MSQEIRVYIPLTPDLVARLQTYGQLDSGLVGFVVDDEIRTLEPQADQDLWEFLALQRAAVHASNGEGPIAIAAADIPVPLLETNVAPASSATLNEGLAVADVVCFHLGDDALGLAAPTIQTAGPDAESVAGYPIELSWFDISEVAQVVRHLLPPQ